MSNVEVITTTMGFRIAVNKHGIIVGSPLSITEFVKNLEFWSQDKLTKEWRLVNEFFHFDREQELCYFPKYELERLKTFLQNKKIQYTIKEAPPEIGEPIEFLMLPWVSYKNDKQKMAVEFLTDPNSGPIRGLALQTGVGKFLNVDSLIRTPSGWERMGDMYVGKDIIAPDGTVTKVSGVFPQGIQPLYKVSFEDGRSTEAGGDHLWKVNYVQWKDKWRVITTDQIALYLKQPTYKIRMGVPLIKPEIKDDIELPIDPYVLGVILGDGNITNETVNVCKPDQFVKDELDLLLYPNHKTSNWHADKKTYCILSLNNADHLRHAITALGLWGTYSYTKFIPDLYMNASPRQRLSLIQGLMDTDGTVGVSLGRGNIEKTPGKGGSIQYCTTSLRLATQFQEIIRSLGGLCKLTEKVPHYTHNGEYREGRLAYVLSVRYQHPRDLFRLPRKRDLAPFNYQYANRLKLRINSVEYIGDKEAQCIAVDHPEQLYITDDYIVTHNTVSYIMALQRLGRRAITTMTSRLEQWVSEIVKYTNLTEDDIYVIQGVGSLTKLFNQIDKLNPKLILMSTRTMRLYLDYGPTYQHLPHPSKMCDVLKVGIVSSDEAHESFYSNFLMGIMLNPAIFIPITATFSANDPFVKNVFDQVYPKDTQFTGGAYEKFVNVTAYVYTSGGFYIKPFNYMSPQGYSQQMFEKFLMNRGRKVLDAMVDDAIIPIIRDHYINIAEPGEKMLFLCSSTALCDHLEGVFKRVFKDKKVSSFYSGMPTTIFDRFDIILSTPGSSGTGRDIKNLRTCFAFENTKSETRNLQFIGRLRGPPQMLNTPEFVYMSLSAIPQHVAYHNTRAMLYGSRALTFKHRRIT